MNRKIKLVFTISLVLNVFLFGAVAGLTVDKLRPPAVHSSKDLDPESRRLVKEMISRTMEDARPVRAKAEEAKRKMASSLAGEEISEEAYRSAADEMVSARCELLRMHTVKTLEVARELSPEEREKLAAHLMIPGRFSERFGFRERPGRKMQSGSAD